MAAIKTRNGGTMTEAQFFGKIRSMLRSGFRWWIPLQKALEDAKRPSQNRSNKRLKWEYQCNHCKDWHPKKNVEIDHITPCGSLRTYEDIVPFIQRLTAEESSSYQVLCKTCHLMKTKQEKEERNGKNNQGNETAGTGLYEQSQPESEFTENLTVWP